MSDTATVAATVAATEHEVEAARIERHRRFRSNTLPALVTVGPVTLWLIAFIAVPLLYILIMGFCSTDQYYNVVYRFTLDNFQAMLDPEYLKIYGQSILIAAISTAICLVLAYPFSYLISRTFKSKKTLLYMMIIIPFWTNSLVRIYGWRTFLSATGQLNTFLMTIGATSEPIQFLYNQACTVFGMAYDMFPFMVLPLYAAIEKLDESQIEASFDLGANMLATIFKVVIPQTMSGIFSGCIMVFIPSLGAFYIADILGGGNADVIGNLIQRQFQSANDWPLGAALSILLIAITLLLVKIYQKAGGDMESLGV